MSVLFLFVYRNLSFVISNQLHQNYDYCILEFFQVHKYTARRHTIMPEVYFTESNQQVCEHFLQCLL